MSRIEPTASLGDLVAERPGRAGLFERLRFDYCCGGKQTLAEACAQRGLDVDTVRELILALDGAAPEAPRAAERDWREASLTELCDHIVSVHHDYLRAELPRISEVLETVVRVHGSKQPDLHELARTYDGVRAELEEHMAMEEEVLFKGCRAREAGEPDGTAIDVELIDRHEREHADAGDALATMRELAGGYDASRAFCGTHRALLDALRRLEADLHQHIHLENNVLFPRLRELLAQAPA